MSGHSKWAQIKHQKGTTDAKKGALFTKLANSITIAVKQMGDDPTTNFKLRMAIDQARIANMPKINIERAIKRGTGELDGAKIEEIIYEGFGPQGTALIIETLTDNKNRAVNNIKHILNKYNGNISTNGSVIWTFERRGVIRIANPKDEETELKIIDSGAEDILKEEGELVVYSKPDELQKIKEGLETRNIKPEYSAIEWVAKEKQDIKDPELKEKLKNLFEELDNCEDVNNYYTNANI